MDQSLRGGTSSVTGLEHYISDDLDTIFENTKIHPTEIS